MGGDDEDDDDDAAATTEDGAVVTTPSLGVLRFLVGVVFMVGVATRRRKGITRAQSERHSGGTENDFVGDLVLWFLAKHKRKWVIVPVVVDSFTSSSGGER